jgi:hypothetical protein
LPREKRSPVGRREPFAFMRERGLRREHAQLGDAPIDPGGDDLR